MPFPWGLRTAPGEGGRAALLPCSYSSMTLCEVPTSPCTDAGLLFPRQPCKAGIAISMSQVKKQRPREPNSLSKVTGPQRGRAGTKSRPLLSQLPRTSEGLSVPPRLPGGKAEMRPSGRPSAMGLGKQRGGEQGGRAVASGPGLEGHKEGWGRGTFQAGRT